MKLTHPKLPGHEIDVPEQGVAHRERAGWRRVTKSRDKPPAKPAEEKPTEPSASDKTEGTS